MLQIPEKGLLKTNLILFLNLVTPQKNEVGD